jgi:molecular chaperone GrpE
MQNQELNPESNQQDNETVPNETDIKAENTVQSDENSATATPESTEQKIKELNDKYLRLYSEFDNYRKRTIKEKSDIIKTAGEDVFKSVIPVIDDFERAIKANETTDDIESVKQGVHLIYNKFKNAVHQKGLVSFESIGESFNPDIMEAITYIPAADANQKGKVVDEAEKGYKLGEKVIRFAKVIIAQ